MVIEIPKLLQVLCSVPVHLYIPTRKPVAHRAGGVFYILIFQIKRYSREKQYTTIIIYAYTLISTIRKRFREHLRYIHKHRHTSRYVFNLHNCRNEFARCTIDIIQSCYIDSRF